MIKLRAFQESFKQKYLKMSHKIVHNGTASIEIGFSHICWYVTMVPDTFCYPLDINRDYLTPS